MLRRVVALDFLACLDLGDRAYFCTSREAQFGALLEVISVDAPRYVGELLESLAPFHKTLSRQPLLCGGAPAYADYVTFSIFQSARIGRPTDVLPEGSAFEAIRTWRRRMGKLFGRLAYRFDGYPGMAQSEAEATTV